MLKPGNGNRRFGDSPFVNSFMNPNRSPVVPVTGETTSVSSFIPSNAINQKRAGWISLVSRRRRFLVIDDEASFDERLGWRPRRWKRYSVISRSPVTTTRDRRINGLLTNRANAG